ncbi:YqaE/Pmp3 family membrane protein [Fulvimarina sp. MAC3]|uniref:YqaE/Pmp3 family membrane protein n=1 Tax=Fulvimarina sp. MAC3 TaxID=3148887 RepID=UPI0031FBD164
MRLVTLVIGFLIPPFGAWRAVGFSGHFWLNVVLTMFGYLPGSVHSLYLTLTREPKHPG